MKILKGASDEETNEAFKDLTAEQIYRKIDVSLGNEGCETLFRLAVEKGLFEGLTPDQKLRKATIGNSLEYAKKAIEEGATITDEIYELGKKAFSYRHLYYFDEIKKAGV